VFYGKKTYVDLPKSTAHGKGMSHLERPAAYKSNYDLKLGKLEEALNKSAVDWWS
jgi:hypothetical protein